MNENDTASAADSTLAVCVFWKSLASSFECRYPLCEMGILRASLSPLPFPSHILIPTLQSHGCQKAHWPARKALCQHTTQQKASTRQSSARPSGHHDETSPRVRLGAQRSAHLGRVSSIADKTSPGQCEAERGTGGVEPSISAWSLLVCEFRVYPFT